MTTRVTKLWDLIEARGFRKNIEDISNINDDDGDDDDDNNDNNDNDNNNDCDNVDDDDDDDDEMMMMMKEKSFVTLIGKRARSHFERLVPATNNHQ